MQTSKDEANKSESGKKEAGKKEAGKKEAGKKEAGKKEAGKKEAGTVEARQRLLGAAMANGSRSRLIGGHTSRRHSSRLRLDAAAHIALAARSNGASSRTVDSARDTESRANPGDATDLGRRLRTLAHRANVVQAELLEALVEFDQLEGWRADGAKSCVQWICSELGVGRSLAYSQLFVARKLRDLPIIAALFRDGELSWSKVQALTRIATSEDERALAIMALDLDANAVQQICDEYRWGKGSSSAAEDAERDRERFERRSFTWSHLPDGSLSFRTVLPPDMAANFLVCMEHRESLEFAHEQDTAAREAGDSPNRSGAQRRADALVAMAEASLVAAGKGVSTADRFQVVVHVDAEALEASAEDIARRASAEVAAVRVTPDEAASSTPVESSTGLDDRERSPTSPITELDAASPPNAFLALPVRAAIAGVGGISPSTARRLACDGSLITLIMKNGEPLSVGRKTRRWNPATRRAVLARDGGCTFPGCGSTRNLDIHHVDGWALGGETSVERGVTLCRSCHTKVHDEGWRIRRITDETPMNRHPRAASLLDEADGRTRDITRVLDARRSKLRFERNLRPGPDVDAQRQKTP